MSSILLRKLTKKSTLKFGKYKDCTVDHLIAIGRKVELISAYFKLSAITFTDDILDELDITEEYRIEKPSTNVELYQEFMKIKYGKRRRQGEGVVRMGIVTVPYKKSQMCLFNQGKRY
jgi:hypothetical protein